MVDTQLLEKAISDSGKSKKHLAQKMGISVQAFRLKCLNKSIFNTAEVAVLCDELNIRRLTDKESIFFKKNVDRLPT